MPVPRPRAPPLQQCPAAGAAGSPRLPGLPIKHARTSASACAQGRVTHSGPGRPGHKYRPRFTGPRHPPARFHWQDPAPVPTWPGHAGCMAVACADQHHDACVISIMMPVSGHGMVGCDCAHRRQLWGLACSGCMEGAPPSTTCARTRP